MHHLILATFIRELKNKTMKQLKIIIILLGTYFSVMGQKNWEDKYNGFVKTTDGLLVEGYLRFEVGFKNRGTRIKLYKKPNESPEIFYTLELREYAFNKDTFKIFTNIKPFENDDKIINIVEAKRISSGKLDVYEIPEYYSSHVTIPSASGGAMGMTTGSVKYIYLVFNKNGQMTGIRKDIFEEKIKELMPDRQDIINKINSGELKFKHIKKIFASYNETS